MEVILSHATTTGTCVHFRMDLADRHLSALPMFIMSALLTCTLVLPAAKASLRQPNAAFAAGVSLSAVVLSKVYRDYTGCPASCPYI